MGRTCGEPDEIGLTAMGVTLNGFWDVPHRVAVEPVRVGVAQQLRHGLVSTPSASVSKKKSARGLLVTIARPAHSQLTVSTELAHGPGTANTRPARG